MAWLSLAFIPGLTGQAFVRLLGKAPAEHWLDLPTKELIEAGFSQAQASYLKQESESRVTPMLEWQQGKGKAIITPLDPSYPALLAEVSVPPRVLFVEGQADSLQSTQLAMVGSRHATIDGLNDAKRFAAELSRSGITITSGLALGIDGSAHHGALEAKGVTIAVLGSGHNRLYPAKHRSLAEKIIECGALVSEFPPDTPPKRVNFPRRNRIISGLATGVLVVEAAERSGSLITARYAAEQGREVFALPGSIHTPTYRGNHQLIKNGACLVQTVDDILVEIDTLVRWSQQAQSQLCFESAHQISANSDEPLPFPQLFANVGLEPTPIDILASRTHINIQEAMNQILELELLGAVRAVPGGYVRLGGGKL